MNAYELADELDGMAKAAEVQTSETHAKWHRNIATMLRQQAKRIEELEADLALKTRDRDVFCNFTLAYEKRIEELERRLANPVGSFDIEQAYKAGLNASRGEE